MNRPGFTAEAVFEPQTQKPYAQRYHANVIESTGGSRVE